MNSTWTCQITLINSNPTILCYKFRNTLYHFSGSCSNESSHIHIPKISNQVTGTLDKECWESNL
uniref:Uncharacterized protein n=1 Tax=Setaria italica TaxID=4555 RepID=K3ZNY3_SETIT